MKKIKSILAMSTVVLLWASCAKDGETGPKGDTGATGAQGPGATTYAYTVTSWGSVPDILTITAADGLNCSYNDAVLSYFSTSSQWALFPYQSFIGGGVFIDYRPYFGMVS